MDQTNIPLYNQFGIYIGSIKTQELLSSVGNSATRPISPSDFSSGQTNAQISVVGGFLQSSNFVTGSAGWQINSNGDVEFNNGIFRGTLSAVTGTFGAVTVATNGSISSGQTAYDTGTGFWMGNVSGTTKFSLGNSAGNKMTWDGSSLSITGNISATTGSIGGWTIGATTLTGGGVTLDSSTGSINGATITGSTLTTGSTGQRVELTSSNITLYDSSNDQSATFIGYLKGAVISTATSYGAFQIYESGSDAYLSLGNQTAAVVLDSTGISLFNGSGYGIGVSSSGKFTHSTPGGVVDQPTLYFGYVSGTSLSKSNVSWTISNPATGKYTVNHDFTTDGNYSDYTVVATALRASGAGAYSAKIESIGTNDFKVTIFDDTGSTQNSDFMFLLTKI